MYLAIDIGGTKTLIAAYSEDGDILRKQKYETPPDFTTFMEKLIEQLDDVLDGERVDGIAVAAPALIDYDTQIAKRFGNLGWHDVDIVGPLKERYTDNVHIDNDANMGALGEANMGAGVSYEKMLYITVSTGIGTGVTYNGQISPALRESEGGMMKFRHEGKLMEWEDFASGRAYVQEFGKYGADDVDPKHWKEWSEDLSIGLVDLIAIIQPDIVVIGGSMGNHIHKYHDFLHEAIQSKRGVTVEMPMIIGAKHPDEAVINGCYIVCKQSTQD